MVSLIRRLIEHMVWADQRMLRSLEEMRRTAPPRAFELVAHLFAAEHIWLCRILEREPSLSVWPPLTLEECSALADRNAAGLRGLVEAPSSELMLRTVRYRNSVRQEFESTVSDMLPGSPLFPAPGFLAANAIDLLRALRTVRRAPLRGPAQRLKGATLFTRLRRRQWQR